MDREQMRRSALDPLQISARLDLASYTAKTFQEVGTELHIIGHFFGSDDKDGKSPYGHGDDSTVAISMLLRIGSQLVSASADLIADGRHYAGTALIRQLVEVEYLSWAFDTKNEEAARWLRSNHTERINFFTPAKLRKAAGDHFRGVDYGYHCELGGHPVPGSWTLLNGDNAPAQLMLSDCLGHSGRIWDHICGWARSNSHGRPALLRSKEMWKNYSRWKEVDELVELPPPPDFPPDW
jgi:hypothetical protein